MTTVAPTPTFDDLYIQYSHAIYERVLFLVRDATRAEDLTQETFIKVWRFLPKIKHTHNLSAWLFTVATNTVRDDVKRARRRSAILAQVVSLDEDEGVEIVDEQADPEAWYLAAESPAGDIGTAILERLNPAYRKTLLATANKEAEHSARERYRRYRARQAAMAVYRDVVQERMVV